MAGTVAPGSGGCGGACERGEGIGKLGADAIRRSQGSQI